MCIEWNGYKWQTIFWQTMHPDLKARANCWEDPSAVKVDEFDRLILDIKWNPKDENLYIDETQFIKAHADYGIGKVISVDKFGLGNYKLSCILPQGNYLWPAFWLYNDEKDNGTEIDIFEGYSKNTDYMNLGWLCYDLKSWNVASCIHTKPNLPPVPAQNPPISKFNTNPSITYNTYELNWQTNYLAFLINGKIVREITDTMVLNHLATNARMKVILNTHIDGSCYKKFKLEEYSAPFVINSFKYTPL
jgi:beta-glucanase (GH16 family)